jgi:TonB family protein
MGKPFRPTLRALAIRMTESWKQWQGRSVNGRFPLQTYLGGSDHSAVYLTSVSGAGQSAGENSAKAAIKLMPAGSADAQTQISRWQELRKLDHPSLIRIIDSGNCEIDGVPLLYVVMQYAEENLAQVLPERPLTAEEARGTLPAVLQALQFVHDMGYVHGHLKPTNILASGDQVKLSSETLAPSGDRTGESRYRTGIYDPPEAKAGAASPATDIWQLGMTLAEVLTQRLPVVDQNGAVVIPQNISEPFRDIIRHCLQPDAGKRWTIAQIGERLKADGAGADRLSAAAERQTISAAAAGIPQASPARDFASNNAGPKSESVKWPMWVAIAAVIVIAFFLIARPKRSTQSTEQVPTETQQGNDARNSSSGSNAASSEAVNADSRATPETSDSSSRGSEAGVVERVIPQVSPSARRTIQGKIKVRVRVNVDAAGTVSKAVLESAGPSKYFSRIAMEAARRWRFAPAGTDEQSGRRVWRLQFAFTRSKTEASATPVKR